jgi:tetratricopeptide (TPR) repeat protein
MKKLLFLCLILAATAMAAEPVWRVNYYKGLQYISQGKYEDAIAYLKMAVADKPISDIVKDNEGTLEYLPYLQLGISYYHLGKTQLATEFLDLENSLSAIGKSAAAQDLMKSYRQKILKSQNTKNSQDAEQTIREFSKKPYVLSEEVVKQMKEDIRQRCNLPRADERTYPWYYHYELGVRMKQKNDWQRALDSFISALDFRDRPQRFSRIYGMWFIDYYPYYNIGLAHYHLGNWKCAEESFRLSQMLEDLPSGSSEQKTMLEMRSEVERNLGQTE